MVAHLFGGAKNWSESIYFKWATYMVCELYLNKAVKNICHLYFDPKV